MKINYIQIWMTPKSLFNLFPWGPDPTEMVPKIELHRHPQEESYIKETHLKQLVI